MIRQTGNTISHTDLSPTDKAMINTCLRCRLTACRPQHKHCPFIKEYGCATPTVLRQNTTGKQE